jgi:hypothetical protein
LGILDDFRNLHAFLEFRIYGELEVLNISVTHGPKAPQASSDSIALFINFQKQFETKTRHEAVAYLRKLLESVPAPARKVVESYGSELLTAIT